MAHFIGLGLLPGNKPGELHNNAHQHNRTGLRGFARQGHNAGKNPFPALSGNDLIHIRDIGVGIPWHVVDSATTQSRDGRDQQQQRVDIAQPGVIENRIGQ